MIVYIDQWCQFSCQQPLLIMWSLCNERHANSWIIGIALSFRQTKLREADWINYVHLQDDSIDLLQYYKTHPDPWNGHSHEVISTDVQTSSRWKWPSHIACFNSHTFFFVSDQMLVSSIWCDMLLDKVAILIVFESILQGRNMKMVYNQTLWLIQLIH